jgi:hypothetical protein
MRSIYIDVFEYNTSEEILRTQFILTVRAPNYAKYVSSQ